MAVARVASARQAAPVLLSIGQVLAKLTPEFPDLSPSKLRFLGDQGLVSPARTDSGYRKFSPSDVERVRFILTMQRDHYLPLKVIREHLDDFDAGRTDQLVVPITSVASILPTDRRLTRAELVRESGATAPLLSEAVSASLLPAADAYGDDAVAILRALAELRRHGIEPRHLRGLRAAVDREVGLVEQAVAPTRGRRDGATSARAAEQRLEIAGQLDLVRSTLLRSALDRLDP